MRSRVKHVDFLLTFLTIFLLVDLCSSSNQSFASFHDGKPRLVKKLRKDFRKLKKQEGALKLVGSQRGDWEGNVEILHDGKWGSVCDDEWDYLEANVVCRQLGFDSAIKPTMNGHFGQARRRYWMDNVYCDGSEEELSKCRFDGWGTTDCESSEAAGVICTHDQDNGPLVIPSKKKVSKARIKDFHQQGIAVRLAGGRIHSEGRVEIKLGSSGV